MAVHDFRSQRLYVEQDLTSGKTFEASREQGNYLLNVLRIQSGGKILLFNGRDGEWQAEIEAIGRKKCLLHITSQTRPQPKPYLLRYCFAPLKQGRLDYMVQKAVEMGVGVLQPVLTQYTQVRTLNEKRLKANAIEAAEQCGILNIPVLEPAITFNQLIANIEDNETLIFCDEDQPHTCELSTLNTPSDLSLLIGPEGGFSEEERNALNKMHQTVRLGLGPRILRADTAAVAALAIIQARIGDWYLSTNH